LFSATLPPWVAATAAKHLRNPVEAKVDTGLDAPPEIEHVVYEMELDAKIPALRTFLDDRGEGPVIVFGRTGFLRQAVEVRQGQRQLAFRDPPLGTSQEQPKPTLPHLWMHPVDGLGLGEEGERLADGATVLRGTDQVEQGLKVLGMGAAPRLRFRFGARGLARLVMRDQGTKHLWVGVCAPSPLQ